MTSPRSCSWEVVGSGFQPSTVGFQSPTVPVLKMSTYVKIPSSCLQFKQTLFWLLR